MQPYLSVTYSYSSNSKLSLDDNSSIIFDIEEEDKDEVSSGS